MKNALKESAILVRNYYKSNGSKIFCLPMICLIHNLCLKIEVQLGYLLCGNGELSLNKF